MSDDQLPIMNQSHFSPREAPTKNGDVERIPIRERVKHFTWSNFECTMSTGAIATLLSQQPNSFHGLRTVGKIFFILDLVLFIMFTALIIFRFWIVPRALKASLHHKHESFFFGTFWVSLGLIIYCVQQYAVPSCGPWLIKALEVCFWLYAGSVMLVAIFQYHVIFDVEKLPLDSMMPAWILPIYPFLILGPLAGALLYTQPTISAIPILIGGIMFQGLGFSVAFMMYTIYVIRLLTGMIPDESKRPGMFVSVGPAAYTAQTLVQLGTHAQKILPPDFIGPLAVPVGDVWKATGVFGGIFIWLLGFWFSAISLVGVMSGIRKMHFTLNWWAFVFPNAGLTIAAIQIGNVLSSTAIQWFTSVLTIILVLVWLVTAVAHVRGIWLGLILWPGMVSLPLSNLAQQGLTVNQDEDEFEEDEYAE